ncbi:hypothetical protein EBT25_18965, partial [bacterium]|nr:hypothetical protein [bacterium]
RPVNEVIDDLQRNAGHQFAPELVSAFLRGMMKELTGEAKEKRFRQNLGREYMESEGLIAMLRSALNNIQPTNGLRLASQD